MGNPVEFQGLVIVHELAHMVDYKEILNDGVNGPNRSQDISKQVNDQCPSK
jgi:hypothetical protein